MILACFFAFLFARASSFLELFTCEEHLPWKFFKFLAVKNREEGFPVDLQLFQISDQIVRKYGDRPYPPQEFFRELCREEEEGRKVPLFEEQAGKANEKVEGGEAEKAKLLDAYSFFGLEKIEEFEKMQRQFEVFLDSEDENDFFCMYGFITALFIRARHLIEFSKISDQHEKLKLNNSGKMLEESPANPSLPKNSELIDWAQIELASNDLQYGAVLLGREHALDFLEDSGWPVELLDLYVNLNQSEFSSFQAYKKRKKDEKKANSDFFGGRKSDYFEDYFENVRVFFRENENNNSSKEPKKEKNMVEKYFLEEQQNIEENILHTFLASGKVISNIPNFLKIISEKNENVEKSLFFETKKNEKTLNLYVVGTHGTLSLEPVDRIIEIFYSHKFFKKTQEKNTFLDYFENVDFVFRGLEPRWCEMQNIFCAENNEEKVGKDEISEFFRFAEKNPLEVSWEKFSIFLYRFLINDKKFFEADILICTEPMTACMIILEIFDYFKSKFENKSDEFLKRNAELLNRKENQKYFLRIPKMGFIGYFGVAIHNLCPPQDLEVFWEFWRKYFGDSERNRNIILATNNFLFSEQIFYQTGRKIPTIRPVARYAQKQLNFLARKKFILEKKSIFHPSEAFFLPFFSYSGILNSILVWKSVLFGYHTFQCALLKLLQRFRGEEGRGGGREGGKAEIHFEFMNEGDPPMTYESAFKHRALVFLPWDHAQLTFFEFFSAGVPLLVPEQKGMLNLLYQRGQLSVGERLYQSVLPGHEPYLVEEVAEEENIGKHEKNESDGGLRAAGVARDVAEDVLKQAESFLDEKNKNFDLQLAKNLVKTGRELLMDMKFFLDVAANLTEHTDSSTSMGVVRRRVLGGFSWHQPQVVREGGGETPTRRFSPFQMSTQESYDYTRKRKGVWWVRRGARLDAMAYWLGTSEYLNSPGVVPFSSLSHLLSLAHSLDFQGISGKMAAYSRVVRRRVDRFWETAVHRVLGDYGLE